jgi:hypothetical protein
MRSALSYVRLSNSTQRCLKRKDFHPLCPNLTNLYRYNPMIQLGDSIEVANRLGLAMVLTGARHFRH